MKCTWSSKSSTFTFSTERLEGVVSALFPGEEIACHRLHSVVHKPTGTIVSPDGEREAGLLSPYKVLARASYLTELRVQRPHVEAQESGLSFRWPPTMHHQAAVEVMLEVKDPNIIDVCLKIEGYTNYSDYQVFLNSYVAPGFKPVVYLGGADGEPEQVEVVYNPVYKGMYNLFPRDMEAARVLYDGRGQSGRHNWWVALGRTYGCAMGVFSNGTTDVVTMGNPKDVQAVGVSYGGDEQVDRVAAHRGLYLPMFGRDLRPGTGWQTQARMVIDDFKTQPSDHLRLYEQFCDDIESKPRNLPVVPQSWV
jgi:hypothetical protein